MTDDNTSFFVTLQGRGQIHIEGEDRLDFLQGLITNDITGAGPGRILYACLLTPQGKFLHDFFIHSGDDFLILDCEGGARAEDLYKRLSKFKLRSKVQLSLEPFQTPVYAVFGTDQYGLPDPRHFKMGFRTFEKPDLPEQAFEVWDKERIILGIPDGSRDMILERSTLLESNLDTFNAIDFDKGCYLGQELTARMHYRGLTKKHLVPVNIDGNAPAPFTDLPDGGSMRSACGDIGLALLKDELVQDRGHLLFEMDSYKIKKL